MKTPITRDRLQQHFRYHWWMYVLSAVLCFFALNLFFSVTEYRAPDEKKLDMFVDAAGMDQEAWTAWMGKVRDEKFPQVEEVSAGVLLMNDAYGPMQLATFMAAGEGDIYILSADSFRTYAGSGAFVPMDVVCPELLEKSAAAGCVVDKGTAANENGEKHIYGFPLQPLAGLNRFGIRPDRLYLCIRDGSQNPQDAVALTESMLDELRE
ncbi:MAG: hypothetical protein Q4C54_03115 [Clostridia bacterium]|nr:hypothetical protein [Clostridia bacterium]